MAARLSVLVAAICFGTTGTAQALGAGGADPLAVGAARIVVGAVLLLAVARHVKAAAPAGADSRPDRLALLVAGVFVAAYQLAFFQAVRETGVAVGTVVAIGSGPVFAGLIERVVGGVRLRRRWVAATALAAAGVALLVVGGEGSAEVDPLGVGLALASGFGYASYTVAAKRLLDAGQSPEHVMAHAFSIGALLLVPVLVVTGGGGLATPGGVATVLYLGAIPTALAYVLFARGLRRISAGETATLTLAEPLTATALGIVVLGEAFGATTVIGAALVLGGIVLLALKQEERPTPVAGEMPAAAA